MDFIENKGLFTQSVFDTFSQNDNCLYISEASLKQSEKRLDQLVSYWKKASNKILLPLGKKDKVPTLDGIPEGFSLLSNSESDIEQGLIRKTLEIIGFEHKIANNTSLQGKNKSDRPDMILFNSDKDIQSVNKALASQRKFTGSKFCLPAVSILEAKKTSESIDNVKHINQIQGYLSIPSPKITPLQCEFSQSQRTGTRIDQLKIPSHLS